MWREGVAEAPLRVLVIHGESIFCAGAQRMLGYFLDAAPGAGLEVTVGMASNSKLEALLPRGCHRLPLPVNQRFSLPAFLRQITAVRRWVREHSFDLLHGWTARDWELTSACAWATRRPGIGLLHDHPRAPHLSPGRQRMMRVCARAGLSRTLCVSDAVASACAEAGYPRRRLCVVRNGIMHPPLPSRCAPGERIRLGYLGVFSERKGLRILFEMVRELSALTERWELHMAGGAQDEAGNDLVEALRRDLHQEPWWPRVHWLGWLSEPAQFLSRIDLMVLPSAEFDPFPTVLLEAGGAACPVLAARVGGVPEIVIDGQTGWLFEPRAPAAAAARLADLLATPDAFVRAGEQAARRVRSEFMAARMAADYRRVYLDLIPQRRESRR
jgi:glycosyltransferase involved in cell wall biosynthesis